MKKIITLLLVTFLVAFFASCSFAAEDKVGYVDDVAILREFPKFKKAQEQLEALSKTKADKAKAIDTAQAAQTSAAAKQQKRADLASRVDARVASAKEKAKAGMKKAAGFLGRKLGSIL